MGEIESDAHLRTVILHSDLGMTVVVKNQHNIELFFPPDNICSPPLLLQFFFSRAGKTVGQGRS